MIQKCVSVLQLRVRTYWRTMCVLVIFTLTVFIVWTISYDVLTVAGDVKYPVQTGARNIAKSMRSSLLNILNISDTGRAGSLAETNFTGVVLLTYMRSGSSLTGEILQQNEHVFYVFEPLRVLSHLVKTNQPVLWFNGTRSPVTALNITSVKKQTLIGWLTCNFSLVPSQSFDDWYFLSFGKKTDVYNNCIFKHFGIRYNNHYPNSSQTSSILHIRLSAIRRGEREKCLQKLQNTCLSSKFRIVKTIRTSMSLADEILKDVYGSKIIHLIRDPRSTVLSQAHYSGCPGGKRSVVACSNFHCKRVDDDTEFKQKLLTEKPARVIYHAIRANILESNFVC
ncbi:uncharacterized protein LOC132756848 [Ruditapes philippinarum]|uniref:uncharacterized protein LOC132756848 n=1 Tax=Ruditapes philippinarum TaxID=129788 RepID=UPI00295AB5DB|nr:uncharacterized protein LOC132756848 [Ruditapes philippinarum]